MKFHFIFKHCCAAFAAVSSGSVLSFLVASSLHDVFAGNGVSLASAAEKPQDVGVGAGQGNPRIAIIGGGIGGTSASYFLRKLFGPSASIDLYEPRVIGGRIATVHIAGRDYESGGSIIHPDNKYMVNFRDEFGLKTRARHENVMGFYNGTEFVFTDSEWAIVTILRLLWRYGWDTINVYFQVNSMMSSFSRIYQLQDDGQTYNTPANMLHAMGGEDFVEIAHTPIQTVLKRKGFCDRFIDEVASVAMRDNYGQSINITGFAGMVSLAGVQPGLWSVNGGNKKIPQALLKSSGADWNHAKVSSIRNVSQGGRTKFEVTSVVPETNQISVSEYDMVVIATPLTPNVGSDIEFYNFTPNIGPFGGRYQRTVATFIHGRPNPDAFGKKPGEFLPDVETTQNISLKIRTLAKNYPVDVAKDEKIKDTENAVYKVFSGDLLSDDQIRTLFVSHDSKEVVDWLAYPYYTVDDKMPLFVLSEGLFYINGIEWAASAMEMLVIGARNVALLAQNHWQGTSSSEHVTSRSETQTKNEL